MKNLGNLMKQAKEMQDNMEKTQAELEQLEVQGTSAAGMVTATLTGKGIVRSLKVDPSLVDPEEVEVLEDLIVAAINDAKSKADAESAERMKAMTGGLQLPPGMKLPF